MNPPLLAPVEAFHSSVCSAKRWQNFSKYSYVIFFGGVSLISSPDLHLWLHFLSCL